MDCWVTTSPGPIITVSKYSVPKKGREERNITKMTFVTLTNSPENDPVPYDTDWRMGISGGYTTVRRCDTYHTVPGLHTGTSPSIGVSSSYPGIRASRVNDESV